MNPLEVRPLAGDPLADPSVLRALASRYLLWDAFVAGRPRIGLEPLWLPPDLHRAAVAAAEGVVAAVHGEVAGLALADPDERARYRLPPDVVRLALASHAAGDRAALVRVDLLLGEDGAWHACELNADCPGGHNEALALPRLARGAGFLAGDNPTDVVDRLADRLSALAAAGPRGAAVALVYCTAYAEDLQVCALLQRALEARGTPTVRCAPNALRPVPGGGLRLGAREVAVLYRFTPTEFMEGQANLAYLEHAVRAGRVRTLSSFTAMFAQSKLSLARAWSRLPSLSPAAAATVRAHLPPSWDVADLPHAQLLAERPAWVLKRALGRVGDEVFVGALVPDEGWGPLLDEVLADVARGVPWVAQAYVPQRPVPTPWGPRLVTLGAYVLDGRFAGYFARVTPQSHVSHDALCVPVFTEAAS